MPNKSDTNKPKSEPTGAPELGDTSLLSTAQQKKIEDEYSLKNALPTPEDSQDEQPEEEIVSEQQPETTDMEPIESPPPEVKKPRWRHKKLVLVLLLLASVAALFAVPATRYPILGTALKRNFEITVIDDKTGQPVSGARVSLHAQTAVTDIDGKATLAKVKVGYSNLVVEKTYYKNSSQQVLVPVRGNGTVRMDIVATGRQVPIAVLNKISGKPVADATIKVLDAAAKTDDKGKATIVLPTGKSTQKATVTAGGHNQASAEIQITDSEVAANTIKLTPSGRVYFLSNLSGNIDVISTNLDGTGRKTILAGAGDEDPRATVLLASRDWKYLALVSKQENSQSSKLHLVNASSGKTSVIEEGNLTFIPVGWSGHNFVYQAQRANIKAWQSKEYALKSYGADSGKLMELEQTVAEGKNTEDYAYQLFSSYNIVADKVIYSKSWYASYASPNRLKGKKDQIVSIGSDGTSKRVLREFARSPAASDQNMYTKVYKPEEIIFSVNNSSGTSFYEYDNNNITQTNTVTLATFNKSYPTYLVSPSAKQTSWVELRDGKNTLLVGNRDGDSGKQVASLSDYNVYGWFTDEYLLISKEGSELYIMPATGGTPLKITDYYKVQQNFNGYGYGYGGL